MSSIDTAVKGSRRLERLLAERYGASGKGLIEKLDSVSERVPAELHGDLRWVARIRNRVVHQQGEQIEDPDLFRATVDRLASELEGRPAPSSGKASVGAIVLGYVRDLGAFFGGLLGVLALAALTLYGASTVFGAESVFTVVGGGLAIVSFIAWAAHFQKNQQG